MVDQIELSDTSLQRIICRALATELPPEVEIAPATDRHGMEYIEVWTMGKKDRHIISIVKGE
jgi:hypothetical protein